MTEWLEEDLAAANAIINGLCIHLNEIESGGKYVNVINAIQRRLVNWYPTLQQIQERFHCIAEITRELEKLRVTDDQELQLLHQDQCSLLPYTCTNRFMSGSQGLYSIKDICSYHENCKTGKRLQFVLTKCFSVEEELDRGRMVNVVQGLNLIQNIFTRSELSKLDNLVNLLLYASRYRQLSGNSYILFNQHIPCSNMMGHSNRREMIQFGEPLFESGSMEEAAYNNETNIIHSIPPLLVSVIDHLILWKLILESEKPNGCIISYFNEGEHSQPFWKPPHLLPPMTTLFLSKSTMTFGRNLVMDGGNCGGKLEISLMKGDVLLMRGNSLDLACHLMCPSPNKRMTITFFRVPPKSNHNQRWLSLRQPSVRGAMSVGQPVSSHGVGSLVPNLRQLHTQLAPTFPYNGSNIGGTEVYIPIDFTTGSRIDRLPTPHCFLESPFQTYVCDEAAYGVGCLMPNWRQLHTPLAPTSPCNGSTIGGTGVFIPTYNNPGRRIDHLPTPPRSLELPSQTHVSDDSS